MPRRATRCMDVSLGTAAQAEGRTISLGFHVRLTPPDAPPGDTDSAMEIGRGLIREAMLMLKSTGEAEGFAVEITATNVVY